MTLSPCSWRSLTSEFPQTVTVLCVNLQQSCTTSSLTRGSCVVCSILLYHCFVLFYTPKDLQCVKENPSLLDAHILSSTFLGIYSIKKNGGCSCLCHCWRSAVPQVQCHSKEIQGAARALAVSGDLQCHKGNASLWRSALSQEQF